MARVLKQPAELESPSGKRTTPSAALKSGSKHVRRQRVLTNVSSLGEIHLVDMSVEPSLLDTTDCVLMSDSVDYWEPETYQESLLCAEPPEWRRAKRDALFERQVMRVVPTLPGARPIKSRYVYKRTTRMVQSSSIRHA